VQRDRADDIDARHGFARERSAAGSVRVVRLDHVAFEAVLREVAGDLEVAGDARHGVGPAVDVEVVGAAHEVAGTARWGGVAHSSLLRLSPWMTSRSRLATVPSVMEVGAPSSASSSREASISWKRRSACKRVPTSKRRTSPGVA